MSNRLVVFAVIIVGIGSLLYFVQNSAGKSSTNMTIEEKMRKADKSLEDYYVKADEILNEMSAAKNSQAKVITKMNKYTRLTRDNVNAFNRLQLPCPGSSDARDPALQGHIDWSRKYYEKSEEIEREFNQRVNRVLDEAGMNRQ